MSMTAHTVYIKSVEEGFPIWEMSCIHEPDKEEWFVTDEEGEGGKVLGQNCWLKEYWDECGSELLELSNPVSFPCAVRPSDDWSYDNAGTLVKDEDHSPSAVETQDPTNQQQEQDNE